MPFLLSTSVEPRFCFSVNSLNKLSFEVRTKRLIKTKAMEFYSDVFSVSDSNDSTRFFSSIVVYCSRNKCLLKNDD